MKIISPLHTKKKCRRCGKDKNLSYFLSDRNSRYGEDTLYGKEFKTCRHCRGKKQLKAREEYSRKHKNAKPRGPQKDLQTKNLQTENIKYSSTYLFFVYELLNDYEPDEVMDMCSGDM